MVMKCSFGSVLGEFWMCRFNIYFIFNDEPNYVALDEVDINIIESELSS